MAPHANDQLKIADVQFRSRLIVGTGKYRSNDEMRAAIADSGCEMVTLAVKRIKLESDDGQLFMETLKGLPCRLLPNTAGCATADEAVFVAQLARELFSTNWVKLEVIPDKRYLMPDPLETFAAATRLIGEGFTVLPYIGADPVLARRLAEIGCATVMPLGSPIGSGRGVLTAAEIAMIIEDAAVPVVVDAGLGVPSDAALVMEMGADAVLVNSAIALAGDSARMARAFRAGVAAGREAHLAQRMDRREHAAPSSPVEDAPRRQA